MSTLLILKARFLGPYECQDMIVTRFVRRLELRTPTIHTFSICHWRRFGVPCLDGFEGSQKGFSFFCRAPPPPPQMVLFLRLCLARPSLHATKWFSLGPPDSSSGRSRHHFSNVLLRESRCPQATLKFVL